MPNKSNAGKIAAGVGVAALGAAAAAAYFLKTDSGKKNVKQMSAMAKKAKTEMLSKIKKMKVMSKQAYHEAAEEVLAKYKELKNIDPSELKELGAELKGHWDSISKSLQKAGAKTVKSVTSSKKKVSKKK